MTIATGVAKSVAYKAESTWGTAAGSSGAQYLRRITSNLSLKKDTYQSAEIRTDYQVADFRHGVRRVEGSMAGELSPGTWKDFMSAAVRKAWASVTALTGLSITIAASGSQYTLTRGSGSYLTDGVKVGDVVRLTAGSFTAGNKDKNLFVTALTATVATVTVLNGLTLTAEGPIASATLAVTGKKTYVPASSHTDPSFTIEDWRSDVSLSHVFTGCKVQQLDLKFPPTGMATIDVGILGKDITTAGSQYFSSPTAATSTGVLAAVNGVLQVSGSTIAILTGLDISIKQGQSGIPVVGSNTYADITEGRVIVDGSMTVLLQDGTFRDYFINETEISLAAVFTTSGSAAADFVGVSIPRLKVRAADMDDGEKATVLTLPFQALYNSSGGASTSSEQSTIVFQDSQA